MDIQEGINLKSEKPNLGIKKEVGKRVAAGALALGLLTGSGCVGDKTKGSEQPFIPEEVTEEVAKLAKAPTEMDLKYLEHEVLASLQKRDQQEEQSEEEEEKKTEELDLRSPFLPTIRPGYEVTNSEGFEQKLESMRKENLPVFKKTSDACLSGIDELVKAIAHENTYDKAVYPGGDIGEDEIHHLWKSGEKGFVSHNQLAGSLFLSFEEPVSFPGVAFDPNNLETVQKGLDEISKKFFSEDFKYTLGEVDKTYADKGLIQIEIIRMLGDKRLEMLIPEQYILFDGSKVRALSINIAQFEKIGEVPSISTERLLENLKDKNSPKLTIPELKDRRDYDDFDWYEWEDNYANQEGSFFLGDDAKTEYRLLFDGINKVVRPVAYISTDNATLEYKDKDYKIGVDIYTAAFE